MTSITSVELVDARPIVADRAGERRLTRLAVVTAFVGVTVGLGIVFQMDPNAYLLMTLPLTVIFQLVVARRPLRALWLLDARPFRLDRIGLILAAALAIVPVTLVVAGVMSGDPWTGAYGVVAVAGAVPAAYAIRAIDVVARRALVRTLLTAGAIAGAYFVLLAVVSRGAGILSDPVDVLRTGVLSFLQYIPVVFVLEEVLFRGALDTYARGAGRQRDRRSSIVVSALWGFWHLPLTFAAAGLALLPLLVAFHTVIGVFLSSGWRRSGNLAVPGVTHALTDAVRNALIGI
jgi:membrane protease YdiL (CAAX protease family)